VSMGARADRPNLPQDCADLLVEFSTALLKYSMYPAGHPALADVATSVVDRATRLFAERDQVAIGVARRQLVMDGIATDPAHPVLARLADCLHGHQLGAVSLLPGLEVAEVEDVLRTLSGESEPHQPLGLRPPSEMPAWRTVRLHPLAFDNLALVEPDVDGADRAPHWHGADLWLGLAQAALAGQTARHDEPVDTDPAALARAIDAHEGVQAYDQVVVGYLLQIAQALRTAATSDADALRVRTSGLIDALRPETLRRLVRASQSGARSGFVRDAVRTLGARAVIDVLKATADVSGETISDGLTRILSKLAAQAAGGLPASRLMADEALREQVSRLLEDWKLEDPNPESYGRLLIELSGTSQRTDGTVAEGPALDGDVRIAEMALELGDTGPLASRAMRRALDGGNVGALADLLDRLPAEAGPAAADLRARLVAPETLARLLAMEPVDFDLLDRLLPWMTVASYDVLLQFLLESSHRGTRRRLLDRLAAAPLDLSVHIQARLQDPRWYVQRNMLVLLERTGRVPDGFTVEPWLSHEDWRVRHEAVRLALKLPGQHDRAVEVALTDGHARLVTLGLQAAGETCPAGLVPYVAAIASDPAAPQPARVQALRVLGHCDHPKALAALVAVADGGRTIFGRARLAAPDAACVEALRSLAQGFATAEEARPLLALARKSPLEAVRAAVTDP